MTSNEAYNKPASSPPLLDTIIEATWGVVYLDLEMGLIHDPASSSSVRDMMDSVSLLADIDRAVLEQKKFRSEIEVQIALANSDQQFQKK